MNDNPRWEQEVYEFLSEGLEQRRAERRPAPPLPGPLYARDDDDNLWKLDGVRVWPLAGDDPAE